MARYTLTGYLDTTFATSGTSGEFTLPLGNDWTRWYPESVAVDSSDRIVVAGYVEQTQDVEVTSGKGKKKTTQVITQVVDRQIAVVRLDSGGDLDNTFGSDGLVLTDVPDCDDDWANSVVVLSDGGVLVGGAGTFTTEVTSTGSGGGKKGRKGSTTTTVSSRGAVLIRYDEDGGLVTEFGSAGIVVDDPNSDDGLGDGVEPHALAIQIENERIVYLTHGRAVRACDLEWGTLDVDFNADAEDAIATYGDVATEVLLARLAVSDADGEAVILSGAMRDETDGSLDGLVIRMADDASSASAYTLLGTDDTSFSAVQVDAQGRIIVAVNTGEHPEEISALRLDEDLIVDQTFEVATPGTTSTQASVVGLSLDGDDVVLTGNVSGQPNHWFVARYLGN